MAVYIGEVVDINDPEGGNRIKVRLLPEDLIKSDVAIDYAYPLLPKVFHVTPKVGEAVLVVCAIDGNKSSQRYYIGPIISQPQNMYYDDYQFGATNLLDGHVGTPKRCVEQSENAVGALAAPDEIAVYGRQNSDIILSNNDIRIRCGARLLNKNNHTSNNIEFNKKNPGFIKLKYHESPLTNELQPQAKQSYTTATVVADEINLISNKSNNPMLSDGELYNKIEQIDDKSMQKIINQAHALPYGDILVDFLMGFLQMFKAHTHTYPGAVPTEDDYSRSFDMQFGRGSRKAEANDMLDTGRNVKIEMVNSTFRGLYDKLLSKNIRIN